MAALSAFTRKLRADYFSVFLSVCLTLWSPLVVAQTYSISGESKDREVALKVIDSAKVSLLLTKKGEKDTVSVLLSSFKGQTTGEEIQITLSLPGDTSGFAWSQMSGDTAIKLRAERVSGIHNIIVDKPVIPLALVVPRLPSFQVYKGNLIVTRAHAEVVTFDLSITYDPVFLAEMAIDLPSSSQKHTRSFWGKNKAVRFIWHLNEKTRKEKLKGVYAVLQEYSSSSDQFYPKRDLTFTINGRVDEDLWSLAYQNMPHRTIDIGAQAEIIAQVKHLPPGDYSAKIKFTAANLKDNDGGVVATLALKIKDHWLWAAIILTLSILFSFVTNKWLNTRRQKLEIRNKIGELSPAWLSLEPPTLGAVKVKSTLKLVEDLSKKIYISNREIIDQKLEEVSVQIKYLDKARRLRKKIEKTALTDMKYRRAIKNYRQISDKIGSDKIDDALGAEIEAALEKLDSWFQPGQFEKCYAKSLEQDVEKLIDEIGNAADFPKEYKDDFTKVFEKLKSLDEKKKGTEEEEELYAVVKVLWERRYKPEVLKPLVKSYRENESVNLLFNEVDRFEWENLKKIHGKNALHFVSPVPGSLSRIETFQPIWFRVFPDNPRDANNYLFKHGLKFRWEITIWPKESFFSRVGKWIVQKAGKTGMTKPPQLTPTTNEPKVVQFIPLRSEIEYKVTAYYSDLAGNDDQLEIKGQEEIRIHPSTIFNINKAFKNIELFAVTAAWLVAGVSGLLTFYYKNDTFGQISDYLTLFLWGAGVDQTKNFIQNFQVYTQKNASESK